jgi:hypothetical protein
LKVEKKAVNAYVVIIDKLYKIKLFAANKFIFFFTIGWIIRYTDIQALTKAISTNNVDKCMTKWTEAVKSDMRYNLIITVA